MNKLLLVNAFLLSCIAAYYSIAGLVAIFAAAVIPVVVMGSILEVSKIVVTSWVYRNWTSTGIALRSYFVGAIVVLMLLTSMGIFGFLSKAHSDQSLVSGDVQAQIAVFDEQLRTERENIDANRKIIAQLDSQVNETIARTSKSDTTGASVSRSVAIRRAQAGERKAAQEAILSAQAKIAKLNEARAPIAAKVREVEAEVGPIKYIAQLIYGQEATSQDTLEQAVRWVIILIVTVFDPLAVGMFIAYNQSVARRKLSVAPAEELIVPQQDDTVNTEDRLNDSPRVEPTITLDPVEPEQPSGRKPIPFAERITNRISKIKKQAVEWERDRPLEKIDE